MIFVNVAVVVIAALALRTLFHAQAETAAFLGFAEPSLIVRLALCALLQPLCIFVHEIGHLLAGLALGQKCRKFAIGPFEWSVTGSATRMRFTMPRRAGSVDLIPATFESFRYQRILVAAAGPAASIISGLFLTALSRRAPNEEAFWIMSFAALCSVAAAVELIPMRWGAAHSDGLMILDAIRGGPALDQVARNLLALSSNNTPLRFRNWPRGLVKRVAEGPADPAAARYNLYLAYLRHQDSNETETAESYLDRLLSTWEPDDPAEYAAEAAYVMGFHRRNALKSAEWHSRVAESAPSYLRLRAEASVEWARGNLSEANSLAKQAYEATLAQFDCGAIRYESELVWEMQQETALDTAAETAA
jgi:hypothetical protein